MSRFFRFSRVLSPLSRSFTGLSYGSNIVVHHVKTKPGGRIRKVLFYTLATYACYRIYNDIVISPLLQSLHGVDTLEDEEDDEEEEDINIFIPFPLTTRTIVQEPYAGNDPEWQEFVRIAKDQKLQAQIRNTLANFIQKMVENNRLLTTRFGKPVKISKWWLDIDYPSRPPLQYERYGLLWTDDSIAWAAQPVDSANVLRMNRILWPSIVFRSTLAFAGSLLKQNVTAVAEYFGVVNWISSPSPSSSVTSRRRANDGRPASLSVTHSPDIDKALERIRKETTRRPEEVRDPSSLASTKKDVTAEGRSGNANDGWPVSTKSTTMDPDKEPPTERFFGQKQIQSIIDRGPWKAFKAAQGQERKPVVINPPRGAIAVSGLVMLEAPRAWIVIDVLAWYDPKTREYDHGSMLMKVRRVQNKVQAPRR